MFYYSSLKDHFNLIKLTNFKYICLCCKSITCSNNWHPGINLADVFLEYFIYQKFKELCSPLMQKMLNSIFHNETWSIPDDILIYIVSFM